MTLFDVACLKVKKDFPAEEREYNEMQNHNMVGTKRHRDCPQF